MARVIAYARQPFNNNGDTRQSPEIRAETIGLRSLVQGLLDASQLMGTQLRLSARTAGAPQCGSPSLLPLFVPATDALTTDLQLSSNGCQYQLTRSEQSRRPPPSLFKSFEIPPWMMWMMWIVHACIIHTSTGNVTLFCETQ